MAPRTPRLALALAAAAAFPAASGAQTDSIVILAGRVLDGRGGARGPTNIVVRGSKIVRLGQPAGRPTYDLSTLTVLPGGIDTHVHITNHFDPNGRAHGAPGTA